MTGITTRIKKIAVAAAIVAALEITKCQHPYIDGVCPRCGKLAHDAKPPKDTSNGQ